MATNGPEDPRPLGGELGNSMDLPLEAGPPMQMPDVADARFSGGVVVMPSAIEVPEVGWKPALVFRFATPLGEFYPPIVLVADDDQMAKLRPLIVESIQMARRGATLRTAGATDV